jgi:acetoin:2,6-dichlorophenolindophenol oxidoreductase subunit alpha
VTDPVGLHRRMLEIRAFEDECQRLFTLNLVRGSTHLCQGQEAVAVGACAVLEPRDGMVCTYRGHGAVLARGAPLDRAMAEILGKAGGLCGGKGGSMHLTDVTVGALGSFATVGAQLPFALGIALTAQVRATGAIALAFTGDGSTNIGAFHEAMNMAAVWRLPLVVVVENNLYGEYSPLATTTAITRLADRATSYGIPGVQVDGNDLGAVGDVVRTAAARARAGDGPTLIEALTYRHKGHSRTDPATYRPEGELERWMEHDPLDLSARTLAESGALTPADDERLRATVRADVRAMVEDVMTWPDPDPEARLEHVWANN